MRPQAALFPQPSADTAAACRVPSCGCRRHRVVELALFSDCYRAHRLAPTPLGRPDSPMASAVTYAAACAVHNAFRSGASLVRVSNARRIGLHTSSWGWSASPCHLGRQRIPGPGPQRALWARAVASIRAGSCSTVGSLGLAIAGRRRRSRRPERAVFSWRFEPPAASAIARWKRGRRRPRFWPAGHPGRPVPDRPQAGAAGRRPKTPQQPGRCCPVMPPACGRSADGPEELAGRHVFPPALHPRISMSKRLQAWRYQGVVVVKPEEIIDP